MFFGSRWLAFALVLILVGLWWCYQIWDRRHEDIRVLRESKDIVERGVVIGFWISGLVVAVLLGTFGVSTVVDFVTRLRDAFR